MVPVDVLRALPKVSLHDHLDGGVRLSTLFELADNDVLQCFGFDSVDELAADVAARTSSGDLLRYLSAFEYPTAVLQSAEALHRVVCEAVSDLADDGVVYAELRLAPHLHTASGLSVDDVLEVVCDAARSASVRVSAAGTPIVVGLLVAAMRGTHHTAAMARAALRWRDAGVVGFDLAGAELGNPASDDWSVFEYLRVSDLPFTIHAGEAAPLGYVSDALRCGASRIGHGVALRDDVSVDSAGVVHAGRVVERVRRDGVLVEVCPTSNVHTAAVSSFADHPVEVFRTAGVPLSVSCDNRTMSDVTLSGEFAALSEVFGWSVADVEAVNRVALDAAFCDAGTKASVSRLLTS